MAKNTQKSALVLGIILLLFGATLGSTTFKISRKEQSTADTTMDRHTPTVYLTPTSTESNQPIITSTPYATPLYTLKPTVTPGYTPIYTPTPTPSRPPNDNHYGYNYQNTYAHGKAYFDALFKKGTVVYSRNSNGIDKSNAIVIISPRDVGNNFIWIVPDLFFSLQHENGQSRLLVICEGPGSRFYPLIKFFLKRGDNISQAGKILNDLFSDNTPGFNKEVEHSVFFFRFNNQVCYPYPPLLRGEEKEVTDPRITFFSNWNRYKDWDSFKTTYLADLIVLAHNHPMTRPFTDYASAEDFVQPFFVVDSHGLSVTAIEGTHLIRIKDLEKARDLPSYNYQTLLMEPLAPIRNKYRSQTPNYVYLKEYRIEQRNAIFRIPQINQALEDFFVKR